LGFSVRALCGKAGSLPEIGREPEIAVQVREVDHETGARREKMRIAMSNGLALMRWHDFRFLQDFSNRDFAWLLIGALLAVAAVWVISRRKRRWF
jgi:hypothetical protein